MGSCEREKCLDVLRKLLQPIENAVDHVPDYPRQPITDEHMDPHGPSMRSRRHMGGGCLDGGPMP